MIPDYATASPEAPADTELARRSHQQLVAFLAPLLRQLDHHLDARLVRTFLATIRAMLTLRHRSHGLLLSELGAYLLSPAHAPAGTKRLSNLLRSPNWSAALLQQYLWHQAQARVTDLQAQGEETLSQDIVNTCDHLGLSGALGKHSEAARRHAVHVSGANQTWRVRTCSA